MGGRHASATSHGAVRSHCPHHARCESQSAQRLCLSHSWTWTWTHADTEASIVAGYGWALCTHVLRNTACTPPPPTLPLQSVGLPCPDGSPAALSPPAPPQMLASGAAVVSLPPSLPPAGLARPHLLPCEDGGEHSHKERVAGAVHCMHARRQGRQGRSSQIITWRRTWPFGTLFHPSRTDWESMPARSRHATSKVAFSAAPGPLMHGPCMQSCYGSRIARGHRISSAPCATRQRCTSSPQIMKGHTAHHARPTNG